MMALALASELVSQNVIDLRMVPHLAQWDSLLIGVSIGIGIAGAVTLIWEFRNAR